MPSPARCIVEAAVDVERVSGHIQLGGAREDEDGETRHRERVMRWVTRSTRLAPCDSKAESAIYDKCLTGHVVAVPDEVCDGFGYVARRSRAPQGCSAQHAVA